MEKIFEWNMYEAYNYILRYLRYKRWRIVKRLTNKDYWPLPWFEARHKLMSIKKANRIIADAIRRGEPFWVGRWGGTEQNMVFEYLKHDMFPDYDNRVDATNRLCDLSGFFPNDIEQGEKFVNKILQSSKDIDLQAMWGRYMSDYIFFKYQPTAQLTRLDCIEPWNMCFTKGKDKPWSAELKGKKVLVIHPFADSIREQYSNSREKIFSNIYRTEDILPEFELKTIKAVQTIAGEKDDRFNDWFEALEWMVNECKKIDFDVAIIGCGAYGYLLAYEIKKMGKIAIHLAGATQLMFGIIGKRWENELIYKRFRDVILNESWIRPNEGERVRNGDNVENSCYW